MSLNDSFSRASINQNNYNSQHQTLPTVPNTFQNSRNGSLDPTQRIRIAPPSRERLNSGRYNNNSFYMPRKPILSPLVTDPNDRSSSVSRKRSFVDPRQKNWLEMLHDKSEKPPVSIPELRQRMDEVTPDESLLEMNKRIQTDLAVLTDNYMKLFVEFTGLQEEYKQVLVRKNARLKQSKEDVYANKIEIEFLKKQLEEKEKSEMVQKMDYESRIQRLRDDLAIEREERASLLEKLTELKTKVHEFYKKGHISQSKDDIDPREKFQFEEKINSLQIELEMSRNRLIERQLKQEENKVLREEAMQISRRVCRFGRIHFVGEAKPMEEIFGILEKIGAFPLASKERLLALEELCVFMNSGNEAAEKLGLMGAAVPCTKSLDSSENAIVLRAAHLLSHICQGRPNCAKQVIENGGVISLKKCLVYGDESTRIEAMVTLSLVSSIQESLPIIMREAGIGKVITLLEEGVQLNSDVGNELAKHALQVLKNIAKTSYGIKEIQMYGGVFSLLKVMGNESQALKRVGTQCLVSCTLDPKYKTSFASLKLVKTLITFFNKKDIQLASDAAKVLGNLSDIVSVREDLKLEGGLRRIMALLSRKTSELTLILLQMIVNLVQDIEIAKSACTFGFVSKLNRLIRSPSNEVKRYASKNLYQLSHFPDVANEQILPFLQLIGVFENLDFEENLETARACYGILNNLLKINVENSPILEKGVFILGNASKMLESLIPLNQMAECMQLVPHLMVLAKNRRKLFSLKLDITLVRLLKRVLDYTEKDCDPIIEAILLFIGILVDEEFQNPIKRQVRKEVREDNNNILDYCVQNEDILGILISILQKYSIRDRLNWQVISNAIYAIETLSHHSQYTEIFMNKGLIRQVMQTLQLAEEDKKNSVIESIISMLVFYTSQEKEWLHMCKASLARALCKGLNSNNPFIKGRSKTCLYDLSFCSMFTQALNELMVEEGLKPLIQAYQKDGVGIKEALVNFSHDVTFRVKLRSYLPHQLLVLANGVDIDGSEFLREIAESNKYRVNRENIYSPKELMDEGYKARQKVRSSKVPGAGVGVPAGVDYDDGEDSERSVDRLREVEIFENKDMPLNYLKYYEPPEKNNKDEEDDEEEEEESEYEDDDEEDDEGNTPIHQNYVGDDDEEDEEDEEEENDEGEDDEEDDDDYDGEDDGDEDDEREPAEISVDKRRDVVDAQRDFLERNGQGDLITDGDDEEQTRPRDLGTENEKVNRKGNPWNKLVLDEAKKIRDEYYQQNNQGDGEDEGEEGDYDEGGDEGGIQGQRYYDNRPQNQQGNNQGQGYYNNRQQGQGGDEGEYDPNQDDGEDGRIYDDNPEDDEDDEEEEEDPNAKKK